MREIFIAVALSLAVLIVALCVSVLMLDTQDEPNQLHPAYWPFSVELSVKDK